jgi:hypothetical protein
VLDIKIKIQSIFHFFKKKIEYNFLVVAFFVFTVFFVAKVFKISNSITFILIVCTYFIIILLKLFKLFRLKESHYFELILYVILIPFILIYGLDIFLVNYLLITLFSIFCFQIFVSLFFLYYIKLFLIIVLLLELISVKIVSYRLENKTDQISITNDKIIPTLYDSIIGHRFKPNIDVKINRIKKNGDTVCSIEYTSDKYNRRISSHLNSFDSTIISKKFLVSIGCSFTFGENISYEHSLSGIIQNTFRNTYKVYNYGCYGYGPHQISLLFECPGIGTLIKNNVHEEQGVFLYSYIHDHLNRVYGGSDYLIYGSSSPDVYVSKNKLIIKKRSQSHLRLNYLISKINICKVFGVKLSYPTNEGFYRRFASIINYIYTKSQKIKPNSTFILLIYPRQDLDLNWIEFLNRNIIVKKIGVPNDFSLHKYTTYPDGHPNFIQNQFVFNKIKSKLKL